MANQSRGPWTVTKRFQDKIDIHHADPTKIGASSLVVARVTCRDTWREEQEANARLIAAAPELLEALKWVTDRLHVHMVHSEDLVAHMRACEVMAKATGESE